MLTVYGDQRTQDFISKGNWLYTGTVYGATMQDTFSALNNQTFYNTLKREANMENKGMAIFETQTLEMPGFVTIELITADARVSHGATARFNTLPTAAVPGPPRRPHTNTQWKHETKYLVWHFIATLAWIHLCFWHRKRHFPLMIPRGQW